MFKLLLICFYCFIISDCASNDSLNKNYFPDGFMFGAATAAFQVEGAWDQDGKGENIWDHACHATPSPIENGDTGDVACDSYHKYKEDVQLLKALGVNHYRFSLSWSRILPTGFINKINAAGIDYYKNLIKELKDNEIEPMVSLYHWDLPQPLQDIGGWPNPLMADYFSYYAKVAFENFGDDVKWWITFNEPKQTCRSGYGNGSHAPMISSSGLAEYHCSSTILKAHAKAYHIYDEEFRSKQNGKVSIVVDSAWFEPNTTDDEDAAETMRQFTFGWFANAVIKGNYPQVMIDRVAARSKSEGYSSSRLPEFTNEEIDYIKGTYDYLSVNTYTSAMAQKFEYEIGQPNYYFDMGGKFWQDESWEGSASYWLKVTPWGTRKLLQWIKTTYDNPEIMITENGVSDAGTLQDDHRISFYQEYLSAILEAIYEDKVKVLGYTAWSLLDNFEWTSGYTEKFGFYQVDFTSENRTRTPKASVDFYKRVLATKCLVEKCEKSAPGAASMISHSWVLLMSLLGIIYKFM